MFRELQKALIEKVRAHLLPPLTKDPKFKGADRLAARFHGQIAAWKGDGPGFRQILETANEIAAATVILASKGVVELEYEPALLKTKKSFDFRVTLLLGKRAWIDVKSVGPAWQDDDAGWELYEAIKENFPGNARLVVDKDLAGAALAGQEFKARWTMAARASEVEKKIALLTDAEKAPVKLLFCSNGALRRDAVEDFAHFYRTGVFHQGDWARNELSRYLKEKEIVYDQTLDGFSYLYLRWETGDIEKFVVDVLDGVRLP